MNYSKRAKKQNKCVKRRNANAHKIIQLQNIKTKLWLIISNAYKAQKKNEREREAEETAALFIFTFKCKI